MMVISSLFAHFQGWLGLCRGLYIKKRSTPPQPLTHPTTVNLVSFYIRPAFSLAYTLVNINVYGQAIFQEFPNCTIVIYNGVSIVQKQRTFLISVRVGFNKNIFSWLKESAIKMQSMTRSFII